MYNEEYSIGCQMSKNAQEIYEISSTSTESAPTLVSDSCLTCATLRNSCYVMERRCCRFRFQKFVYRPERLDTWHALQFILDCHCYNFLATSFSVTCASNFLINSACAAMVSSRFCMILLCSCIASSFCRRASSCC